MTTPTTRAWPARSVTSRVYLVIFIGTSLLLWRLLDEERFLAGNLPG